MFFRMVYKSGQIFLPFCHNSRVWRTDGRTDGRTDRRTEISSQYRVCITCNAVKTFFELSYFCEFPETFDDRTISCTSAQVSCDNNNAPLYFSHERHHTMRWWQAQLAANKQLNGRGWSVSNCKIQSISKLLIFSTNNNRDVWVHGLNTELGRVGSHLFHNFWSWSRCARLENAGPKRCLGLNEWSEWINSLIGIKTNWHTNCMQHLQNVSKQATNISEIKVK